MVLVQVGLFVLMTTVYMKEQNYLEVGEDHQLYSMSRKTQLNDLM